MVFHSIRSVPPVVGVVKSGCEIEGETRNAAKFHLESFIQLHSYVYLVFYGFLPTTANLPNF